MRSEWQLIHLVFWIMILPRKMKMKFWAYFSLVFNVMKKMFMFLRITWKIAVLRGPFSSLRLQRWGPSCPAKKKYFKNKLEGKFHFSLLSYKCLCQLFIQIGNMTSISCSLHLLLNNVLCEKVGLLEKAAHSGKSTWVKWRR